MEPKVLLYQIEKDKFTAENFARQMAYLEGLFCHFRKAIPFDESVVAKFFVDIDPRECIFLTTSPEQAKQLQALGISVLGFETDGEDFMQAPHIVLGLEQISFQDFCRAYQRQHGLPWHILDTKRTYLRELCLDDLDDLQALYEAPGVTDYIEPLYPPEQEKSYEEDYIKHIYGFYGYGMWLVFDKETNRLIGRAGLEYRETCQEDEVEMGYVIHPDFWHKGIATEVCVAMMEYAKNELYMKRILCRVDPNNKKSIQLLQKLGFSLDKLDEDYYYYYNL